MKRFFSFLIICCLLCGIPNKGAVYADETKAAESASSEPETEAAPVILPTDKVSTGDIILYSSSCCVMDADTGNILYSKNMDERHYPASITKVLTALLIIENAGLDETITFSQDCWNGLNYYKDMNIGILNGEELTIEAALHAILLSSANEVCNGAAVHISGSVKAFCDLMNERARDLGCTNTHFVNPNGLHDEDHYTSAHDMALIAQDAIKNPTFRKITGTYEYPVASTNLRPEGFVLGHKHRMLMYTNYHYDTCIGGKTGYTEEASNTLVTYAEENGMTLVCVVMENADGHIYPDTITALNYCFDNYEKLTSGINTADSRALSSEWTPLPFEGFDIHTIGYVSDHTGDIVIPKDSSISDLTKSLRSTEPSDNLAPYRTALQICGTLTYTGQDGQTAGEQLLYARAGNTDHSLIPDGLNTQNQSEDIPTFIELRETSAADGTSSDDGRSDPLQSMTVFAMEHLTIVIPTVIIAFFLLTLIFIWLRKSFKRRRHRHNYERLRNERMKKYHKK